MPQTLTDDLKSLSPEERIKRLRSFEQQRKRELEDAKKQIENEIAETQERIKETTKEIDEVTAEAEQRERNERAKDEENLEDRVAERPQSQAEEETKPQYHIPNIYNRLEQDLEQLNSLYGSRRWSQNDVQAYNRVKEDIERLSTYNLSEQLQEQFGIVTDVMNKLKYRI